MESIRKGRFGDRGYRIRGRFIVTAAEWNIPDDAYRWNAILMIKAIHRDFRDHKYDYSYKMELLYTTEEIQESPMIKIPGVCVCVCVCV